MNYKNLDIDKIEAIDEFLDLVDVHVFSSNLRDLFLNYLANELTRLPSNYDEIVYEMMLFFKLLDRIEFDSR